MTVDTVTIQNRLNLFDKAKATGFTIELFQFLWFSAPSDRALLLVRVEISILLYMAAHAGLLLARTNGIPCARGLNNLTLRIQYLVILRHHSWNFETYGAIFMDFRISQNAFHIPCRVTDAHRCAIHRPPSRATIRFCTDGCSTVIEFNHTQGFRFTAWNVFQTKSRIHIMHVINTCILGVIDSIRNSFGWCFLPH